MWKKFTEKIPHFSEVNEPRIYKDKNGAIVGFDMPDEFIDNNHPLWNEQRELYFSVMKGERTDEEFAKYIHTKWGWGNKIDLARNLTSFPRRQHRHVEVEKSSLGKSRNEKNRLVPVIESGKDGEAILKEMITVVDEVNFLIYGVAKLERAL